MQVTLFLLAALMAAAGRVYAVPLSELETLFPVRRAVDCNGEPSELVMACIESLEFLDHPCSGMALNRVDTPQALDMVCEALRKVTRCVETVHNVCHKREDQMTAILYEIMEGVVGHICSEDGKRVILAEAACWEDEGLHDDIENCARQPRNGHPCSIMGEVRDCIKQAVLRRCNQRAAKFIDDLMFYSLKPLADHMLPGQCDIQLRVSRSILKAFPMARK